VFSNRTDQKGAIGPKLCRRGTLEEVLQFIVRQVFDGDLLVDVIPNNGDVDVSAHKSVGVRLARLNAKQLIGCLE